MSDAPANAGTVYDTTNLDQDQFAQMAQMLAAQLQSGSNSQWSVTGPNAEQLLQAAANINGGQLVENGQPAVSTPSNSTAGAPTQSNGFWSGLLQGGLAGAGAAANESTPQLSTNIANAGANPSTPPTGSNTGWFAQIESNLGNWGLVLFGAILAIGALIISQKNTVIKVASTAAKVAAE